MHGTFPYPSVGYTLPLVKERYTAKSEKKKFGGSIVATYTVLSFPHLYSLFPMRLSLLPDDGGSISLRKKSYQSTKVDAVLSQMTITFDLREFSKTVSWKEYLQIKQTL